MKRFSEQIKKQSESIRLKAAEKSALQARLVSFMEYHPLPGKVVGVKKATTVAPYRTLHIPTYYVRSFVGVFTLLLVVSVPALAERSIPGDVLYPIKGVTEEIRSSFNFDSYQKVAWETTRLERRITEARLLAQAGKLTPEVEAGVLAAVQDQKATTESEIETLRTTDAEGATLAQMTFATMLDVQSSVLKANDGASTTRGMSTVALSSVLDAGRDEVSDRGDLETISVERLRAQLEVETTRSYELLESVSKVATPKEQSDVKRRLADIERKVGSIETNDATAQTELRTAWRDIQKLISFMTDIDVRAALAIETLVPVVLTDDERTTLAYRQYEVAYHNVIRIEFGITDITDTDIVSKVKSTIPKIKELLTSASTSLAAADAEGATTAITEATALSESILTLVPFPSLEAAIAGTPDATTTPEVIDSVSTSTATTSDDVDDTVEVEGN